VVSISYRLGPLGYLHGAGDANVWLSDQLAALRWIREHIALFGGDPAGVTVAGQSGGAFSTAALTDHGDLFQRAVLHCWTPCGWRMSRPCVPCRGNGSSRAR
jgi:carboxylesterase type B